jgi:hypothetical protein
MPDRTQDGKIERRLERAERRLRQLRVLLVALVGVVAVFTLTALTVEREQKIVQAERFELVNRQGDVRGALDIQDGSPGLVLFGTGGSQVTLGLDGAAPRLVLSRKGGGPMVRLSSSQEGHGLMVSDGSGANRLAAGMYDGEPEFSLLGEKGNPRAVMSGDPDGPTLFLYDRTGSFRAVMGLPKGGAPIFGLANSNEELIWRAP